MKIHFDKYKPLEFNFIYRNAFEYLKQTDGELSNDKREDWEIEATKGMMSHNNFAERPFAVLKAFAKTYPALSLRNLAWLNPDGSQTALIRQSFLALLTDPALSAQPTPGYLESFDVAVAVANADLVRALLANQSTQLGNDVLSRTTFIALDRIMLRTPDAILDAFAADPRFLADQPNWRASLLARLDPSNPEHVEQLRNYLLKTPHAETELGYFASIYPLANFFEGNRLVTDWETVNQAQTIPERDAAARKLMEGLLAEPGFKGVAPSIETILQRVSPPTATPPASAAPPVGLMPSL